MKFYFCETCGKRLTEADIAEGAGRDKKLKGVFCTECAVGVTTMDTLPLSNEKARQLVEEARPAEEQLRKKRGSRGVPVDRRPSSKTRLQAARNDRGASGSRRIAEPAPSSGGMGIAIAAGVGCLGLIVIVALVFAGGRKPARVKVQKKPIVTHDKNKTSATLNTESAGDVTNTEPIDVDGSAAGGTDGTHGGTAAVKSPASPMPASETPAKAFETFEQKLQKLTDDQKSEKIALCREFLGQHGHAIEGARVRDLLAKLQARKPDPGPVAPRPPPPPGAAVGKTAEADIQAAKGRVEYAHFFERWLARMRARELDEVRAQIDGALQNKELGSHRETVERHRKAIEWSGILDGGFDQGLKKLAQTGSFELRTERGLKWEVGKNATYKITAVKEDRIDVEQKGASMSVMLKSLNNETRVRIVDLGLGTDGKALVCKAFAAFLSEPVKPAANEEPASAAAVARAVKAGAAKEDTEYLDHLIEMRRRCRDLAEVVAAWASIEEHAAAKRWEKLQEGLTAFNKKHGGTDTALLKREAFEKHWNEAAAKVFPTIGLVGHWPFDEGLGPTACDMSAKATHARVRNAKWTAGRIHGALEFTEKSSAALVRRKEEIQVEVFTVTLWFKRVEEGESVQRLLARQRFYGKGAYGFQLKNGHAGAYVNVTGKIRELGSGKLCELNRWYHGAASYDGQMLRLYVDGKMVASRKVGGRLPKARVHFVIGREGEQGPYWRPFRGCIDDVRLYDRPLSNLEISVLYGAADRMAGAPPRKRDRPPAPPSKKKKKK